MHFLRCPNYAEAEAILAKETRELRKVRTCLNAQSTAQRCAVYIWIREGQTEDPALLKGIESVLRAKTEKWVASFTDADKAMYTPVFEKAVGIARQHT